MKVIIVAKWPNKISSGPSAVVNELMRAFRDKGIEVEPLLLTSDQSKIAFTLKVLKTLVFEKKAVVNVHTDGYMLPMLIYIWAKIIKKHRYFLTVHGIRIFDAINNQVSDKKGIFLEKILIKKFDNIITVSNMMAKDMEKLYGQRDNVFVVGNGTDAFSDAEYTGSDKKKIISLGGIRFDKGIDTELLFYKYLKEREVAFEANIYGAGEEHLKWFEGTVEEYGLTDFVKYNGVCYDKKLLWDKLAVSDYFVAFSKYDSFNVSIAESLVLGCPVITTNRCGAAYLIEDGNGLPHNAESGIILDGENNLGDDEFCRAYDYMMSFSNSDKRQIVIKKASAYQKQLRWENIADEYLSCFNGTYNNI